MKFLLDTDHISILQRQAGQEFIALSARIAQQQPADLAFCIVSFHEQVMGCHTYLSRARTSPDVVRGYGMLARVLQDFAGAQVLPFDTMAATTLDGLVAQGGAAGSDGPADRLHCAVTGLTVLTRNLRDFGRVPGLVIEDWTV